MKLVTIDCGTTNSRVYVVDEGGVMIARASKRVGVKDTAIQGSNRLLKDALKELIDEALEEAGLLPSDVRCILSSGMISSELGLFVIPHLWAPCPLSSLADNLSRVRCDEVFPEGVPVYIVPGIKNPYDAGSVSMRDVEGLDFMRGEEAQIAGLLAEEAEGRPTLVTILSSHTKFVPVDEKQTILGSVTTLSGQLYDALLKETFVGKSVRREDDFDDGAYFSAAVVEAAARCVQESGFLRSLMFPRFLDTLVHTPWYDRRLFTESLFAAEDLRAFSRIRGVVDLSRARVVFVGSERRCRIYEHLLRASHDIIGAATVVSEEGEIDRLSIRGVLYLAKRAGVI